MGLAARGLFQSFTAGASGFSSSLQTGLLWRFPPSLRLGVTYDFLNTDNSPELRVLTLGVSGTFSIFSKEPTLLLADYTLPFYAVSKIQFGAEQLFLNLLRARLGYQWEIDNNQIPGFRGFTAGLGFVMGDFDLDYGYAPDGDLGDSQMIGLTYHFPAEKPAVHPVSSLPPSPASISPPPSALHFTPPAEVSPSDRAVTVETLFHIPGSDNAPVSGVISPELQKSLDAAGQRVEQNPKDFQAWIDLGNLYWQSGQPDYTIQCFQEALRLQPENGPLKAWLGHYLKLHPGRE
jgi:tetratricopeptide (TPR) repeat protein